MRRLLIGLLFVLCDCAAAHEREPEVPIQLTAGNSGSGGMGGTGGMNGGSGGMGGTGGITLNCGTAACTPGIPFVTEACCKTANSCGMRMLGSSDPCR